MRQHTCVDPKGTFIVGVHRPHYTATNLRGRNGTIQILGQTTDGKTIDNRANYPDGPVQAEDEDWIYEIANPFPFRGSTFIVRRFADHTATDIDRIGLPKRTDVSFTRALQTWQAENQTVKGERSALFELLPAELQLALATTSTDPQDLVCLARISCQFMQPDENEPLKMAFAADGNGKYAPMITDKTLFKAVANNPHLPDDFKRAMVLRPGIQGRSPIVGDTGHGKSYGHVYEYLRRNSYIPWGHYAANMADDAVRYHPADLKTADMQAMRQLYYQRTYIRIAEMLNICSPADRRALTAPETEALRTQILNTLSSSAKAPGLRLNGILWGWNFGADVSASGYRLHGSHQQIHQQFAMIPEKVTASEASSPAEDVCTYACGDLVSEFIRTYRQTTGRSFFDAYQLAIENNRRVDGNPNGPRRLVVHEDDQVMLFVPKAQTSQWELQLMPKQAAGNIVETDEATRHSLDRAMLTAMQILAGLGARMITTIEYSKRITVPDRDQRLLYSFLPRLPQSPGAFSEAQLRWINGHYPEDFAAACRQQLPAEAKTPLPV